LIKLAGKISRTKEKTLLLLLLTKIVVGFFRPFEKIVQKRQFNSSPFNVFTIIISKKTAKRRHLSYLLAVNF